MKYHPLKCSQKMIFLSLYAIEKFKFFPMKFTKLGNCYLQTSCCICILRDGKYILPRSSHVWCITTAWKVSVFRFFWSLFSRIRTEYNMDWKNSEYGLFLPSVPVTFIKTYLIWIFLKIKLMETWKLLSDYLRHTSVALVLFKKHLDLLLSNFQFTFQFTLPKIMSSPLVNSSYLLRECFEKNLTFLLSFFDRGESVFKILTFHFIVFSIVLL